MVPVKGFFSSSTFEALKIIMPPFIIFHNPLWRYGRSKKLNFLERDGAYCNHRYTYNKNLLERSLLETQSISQPLIRHGKQRCECVVYSTIIFLAH